ncbi:MULTISPECIES: alpha-ketoacid dehydrogenase subunit beta [unclassified Prochlorococcus]|uniref:alpha-ketoacid dehydrogenase subunit beta n=1 Tax=unclassified Prochlorococcus TaxID=2627481 RepID=UPI000533A952|nr:MULTISPECIES: transketolase C-terminal domain-containing protein [unclassified Prochlorococcus]KGG16350.1 Acetoin dehydrogenase E1 component beta-subunit [Prochlorococcus sp. MIT 0603]KGG17916.1 Acetoin dehydrogenase E1 component beta-subunit [Prochlorococcus sp. MIT 0602]
MEKYQLLSYGEACGQAIKLSMRRDTKVLVYGLGVDDPKGMYGTTEGLVEEFGGNRCFDTPLSEDAMTGIGIGMALNGFRPIHVHQRFDFLLLCMNQLINLAAKVKYLSNGKDSCPLIVRAIIGRSWGQGAQHSQSFHSFLSSIPGLTVVAPVTPHDMFNTILWATKYENPVIIVENRMLYSNKGNVYIEEGYEPSIRKLESGNDITVVSISHMSLEASRAIEELSSKMNITSDHFSIVRLDNISTEVILESAMKNKNLLIIDNGWTKCSIAKDILCELYLNGFMGKSKIMGYSDSPCPTPKTLENYYYPNPTSIAKNILELCNIDDDIMIDESPEIKSFRGPF